MKSKLKIIILFSMIGSITPSYGSDDLNAGYGKLIALSATNDISASRLDTDEGLRYEKYTLPYEFKDIYTDGDYRFSVRVRGSYLKIKSDEENLDGIGHYRAKWNMLSFTTSPRVVKRINKNLNFESELEFGYTNMKNNSTFKGDEEVKNLLYENGLLGWNINTLHITPKIGITNSYVLDNHDEINFHGNIAYMFISGIGNEKKLKIKSNTGTWSVGGEYVFTDAFHIKDKAFDLSISNDIGGFYGKDYRELSFGFINNTTLAVETPVTIYSHAMKIKTGIGYLSSDNARGVTLVLEIR